MIAANLADQSVGQFVAERPARARVFEKVGIDYCCGGGKALRDACREKGVACDDVLALLAAQDGADAGGAVDARAMSLTELADHIESTHHRYLRDELPALRELAHKVAQRHGPTHPGLVEVERIFVAFQAELNAHMRKEEEILFPMIRRLEAGAGDAAMHCGSIGNPIRVMEQEHDAAGDALRTMRGLTHDFKAPEGACNSHQALLARLADLEADMHQHVHKENNVLFPRALALESAAQSV